MREFPDFIVGRQEHNPIEVVNLAAFFALPVQFLVPSQGQEPVPITDYRLDDYLNEKRCN